ncbi:MAG: DUF748 domain-containing protein [Candidatus Omnitrophica bacterium]|nr:DUF748 domain-containing protein [Candidatus Omnitrophota bacterium]
MKKLLRILSIFIIFVILVIVSVSAYVTANGRTILLSQLEKNLGIKAQLSSLKVVFPATIVAEGLEVSDTLKAKRLVVVPSIIGLLRGDVVFNFLSIQQLQMTVTRNPDDSFDFGLPAIKAQQPQVVLPGKTEEAVKKETKAKKPLRFYVNKLDILDGHIVFVDKGLVGQPPFVIKCYSLNLNVFRPSLLQLFRMQFNGQGDLLSQDDSQIGRVILAGWADPINLDMDAKAQVEGGKLVYFGPYYKKFVKRELESGDVGITVVARSKTNDMVADCHIELTNVAFKKTEQPQGSEQEAPKDFSDFSALAFNSFLGAEGKTTFDFTVRTKMDKPKFENVTFKGNFFQNRVEAVFSKPPQETIEDFKKVGEDFKAIGKQFKEIFKSK